jgi:hypothetical protein
LDKPKDLLTFKEAAERLNISATTFRKHLADKLNPSTQKTYIYTVKIGKCRLVPLVAIQRYITKVMEEA